MCWFQGFSPEPQTKVGTIFHSKQRRKRRSGVDLVSIWQTKCERPEKDHK
jgi:hypothetical protein